MSNEKSVENEHGVLRRSFEALPRAAKVLGITALGGLVGYASMKGIDAILIPSNIDSQILTTAEIANTLYVGIMAGLVAEILSDS